MRIMTINRTLRLLAALAVFASAMSVARADVIEQILVKVNGEIFTKTDLEARQVAALRQKGQAVDLKSDPANAQLRKMLDEVTPQIVVDAVDEMLVVQRGRELGYKLSDEQFKSVVDNIRKENKLETDEQWQAALKQEGMALPDLRRSLEKQMIVSRVQQNEVFGRIGVSDEEARKYYDEHVNEFTTPPTLTLREILVNVPNDGKALNVGVDEAAKEKADQLRARVVAGEPFEKVAAADSDAPSKANGGLIGPISLSDLSADVRKFLDAMKAGQVSEPVRTPRGWQLIKLETRSDAQTLPFEKAREQISDRVFTGKRQEEFGKYLAKLREQAIIEWKNAEIKKAFDEGLEKAGTAKKTGEKAKG